MRPLSSRVIAPQSVLLPEGDGLVWRAATLDDVPAITALYQAMAAVDHPDWAETEDEVAEEFQYSWVDLELDTAVGESEGRIVAFGQVLLSDEVGDLVRAVLYGGVHPQFRGRGIGTGLLAWQRGRAMQQLAASDAALPGWILASCEERDAARARLLDRAGFRIARYFIQLERDLSEPIPVLDLPPGLRLERMSADRSEPTRVARNHAFRDHWGSQPSSVEDWESRARLPMRRDDLSFLAVDSAGEVVGFVISEVNEEDFERQGFPGSYVSLVGVVRSWRRRGVAAALLSAALEAARADGLERVVLDVDSESPTDALGLYTGIGFAPASRTFAFVDAF